MALKKEPIKKSRRRLRRPSTITAKVLVILGTTASGKTDLAIKLAREFNGEIISADSRQVYRGLDVGSGKDLIKYQSGGAPVPYHLIDVADPRTKFDLARYQKLAFQACADILKRGKLSIIVGGSGLYLQALVDNYDLARTAPTARRAQYEKLAAAELLARIKKLKPEFAARLNNSDSHNARRLARYLEIIVSGQMPGAKRNKSPYNFLLFGLSWSDQVLRQRIVGRILERLEKEGMVAEVEGLNKAGVSWERLVSFGLEYKFISQHLLGQLSYSEMFEKLSAASYRFAKRQKTWFKRWEKQGQKICWIKDEKQAIKTLKKWR